MTKHLFLALTLGGLCLCACTIDPEAGDPDPGADDMGGSSSCDTSAYLCCISEQSTGVNPILCGQGGLPSCPGAMIRIPADTTCASLAPDMGTAPIEDGGTPDAEMSCGAEALTCCDLETQEPAEALCRDGFPTCPEGTNLAPAGKSCDNFAVRLEGRIEPTAAYRPTAKGDIYVLLFDRSPYVFGTPVPDAEVVVAQVLPDEDLSQRNSAAWYTLKGIRPRSEPYYVATFLDVDDSSDPSDPAAARPTRGDMFNFDSDTFSVPSIVLDEPKRLQFGLELNSSFDPI